MKFFLSILILISNVAFSYEMPLLTDYVTDQTNTLSPQIKMNLIQTLKDFHKSQGPQVAVVVINSLQGDTIENVAEEIFRLNKLGSKKKDDGVLLLIAPNDRKLRIEVGYGLEGDLTDFKSNQIIEKMMVPSLKRGNLDEAVRSGAENVIKVLSGEELNLPEENDSGLKVTFNDQVASDMTFEDKILFGAFIFGIIGFFSIVGVFTTGFMSWALYFFMIPFWALFPRVILDSSTTYYIFIGYLIIGFFARIILHRNAKFIKMTEVLQTSKFGKSSGFTGSSFSSGFSSSGSGFSGGGGRSGGGGSSGSW